MNETIKSVHVYLCFFYLLAASFKGAHGQSKSCGVDQWSCKNGQCIREDQACDGKTDCTDGSDETAEYCLDVRCPAYSFQCAYGACAASSSKCDGKQDCADNSDESVILCGTATGQKPSGTCSESEFQCESGECIPEEEACDGTANCKDASDEIVKYCASRPCPKFAFRCAYGGCASGKAKCNGILDCVDGSDESLESCPNRTTPIIPPPRPITDKDSGRPVTPPTSSPPRPVVPASINGGCVLEISANMIAAYEYDPNSQIHNNAVVDSLHSISYKCRKGHVLFGPTQNTCFNGTWLHPVPECSKICSSTILQGVTFEAKCQHEQKGVDCNSPIRPGTRAKISCAVGYREPERANIIDILVCEPSGEWDYYPTSCVPECGLETIITTPFVSNGDPTNITSVPWHTAIYKLLGGAPDLVCGGSIIGAKLVITAAHCFADSRNAKDYTIVVGKIYRNFHATEFLATQQAHVSEIIIPPSYLGPNGLYYYDIALLVLNKFIKFQYHIKPICIQWRGYSEIEIPAGTIGKVAGWGRVDKGGDYSEDLRSIELSVIKKDVCIKKSSPQYESFVNSEKFCVGHEEGEGAVCQGDSGGGFAVSRKVAGVPIYYLYGVLSTSLSGETCGLDYYVTFTNIQHHREMVTEYLTRYRPR